jgi:hypothetical protein
MALKDIKLSSTHPVFNMSQILKSEIKDEISKDAIQVIYRNLCILLV